MFSDYRGLTKYVEENQVKMLDFKVIDLLGRWKHLTIPASKLSEKLFVTGFGFDGSNYGFSAVENSDMVFVPEIESAFSDPFWEENTLGFLGSIFEISKDGFVPFSKDPRVILRNAVECLKITGIADEFIVGPEFEYNIFDSVRFSLKPNYTMFEIDSEQGDWNSDDEFALGYTIPRKGGYHAAAPHDTNRDLRTRVCLMLNKNGVDIKYHHHEVGGAGQEEIEFSLQNAIKLADHTMLAKYFVHNCAYAEGKSATFMPKPLFAEAGNGFHIHMLLRKNNKSVFYDDSGINGLSQTALNFMGGILKHAPALMGFCAPSTNSYKRLVRGYEAPVAMCFGASNRSAVIRIPAYAKEQEERRFEFRAPDLTCNVYLAFASILMAGIDGMKNNIDPVMEGYGPVEKNIYELVDSGEVKMLPHSLEGAINALVCDNDFLDGVFGKSFIADWAKIKLSESEQVEIYPHPKEFELYYDI